MPRLLVTDANILIDLALIEEHELLFLPECSAYTSFDVFYELSAPQRQSWHPFVRANRLVLEDAPEDAIIHLREEVSRGLSDPDCTVIVLAELRRAIILSGDRLVVKTCRKRGREAHGILWLFDENRRIDRYAARDLHRLLSDLMAVNTWLPVRACQDRLDRWEEE